MKIFMEVTTEGKSERREVELDWLMQHLRGVLIFGILAPGDEIKITVE